MTAAAPIRSALTWGRSMNLRRWELPLALACVLVLAMWAYFAFSEPLTNDVGLAYDGGRVAWETGRPETLATWISTPFLAVLMGVISELMSVGVAATLISASSVAAVVVLVVGVWRALRTGLPRWAWWLSLATAVSFAPMVSTLWWKQFNMLALALAVLGFHLALRGRPGRAAAAIAFSICLKPIAVLVPLALLFSRDTRRTGLYALGAIVAILLASQAVLALRADDLGALNPLPALSNFSAKAQPRNFWSCHYENFSPSSMVCRLSGGQDWNVLRAVVLAGVALVAALFIDLLRGLPERSWESFAAACLLSPMISPIAWSHYQVMLFPLMLVLFVGFVKQRATFSLWLLLAGAYALAMLFWQPYGSLPGKVRELVVGYEEPQRILVSVAGVAQFAQYVLIIAAAVWWARLGRSPSLPRSGQTRLQPDARS
jgi:Glycosyltransferase family 87